MNLHTSPSPGLVYRTVLWAILFFFLLNPSRLLANTPNLAQSDYSIYKSSRYSSDKWNDLVRSGIEAFHAGNYDVAHETLYKAFNKGCESPLVLFMLALLNEQKQSFYSALEYYTMAKKGFKKDHKDHRYLIHFNENYGRALYYSGKMEEAMPILEKAGKNSQSYWLLKLLGMLAYERGDTLNAVSYLERAVRVKTDDVTQKELLYIYSLLGRLFLYKGEKDGAMRYFQKVLELDPNNPEAKRFMSGIERQYQNQQMIELMDKIKDM